MLCSCSHFIDKVLNLNEPTHLVRFGYSIEKGQQLSPTHTHTHWINLNSIQFNSGFESNQSAALATSVETSVRTRQRLAAQLGPSVQARCTEIRAARGKHTTRAKRRLLSRLLTPSSGHHHPTSVCSRWLPFFFFLFCVLFLSRYSQVAPAAPPGTFLLFCPVAGGQRHLWAAAATKTTWAPSVGRFRNYVLGTPMKLICFFFIEIDFICIFFCRSFLWHFSWFLTKVNEFVDVDEWRESKRRLTMKNVKETKRRKHVKFCPLVDYWLLTNGEFLMKNNLDTLCVWWRRKQKKIHKSNERWRHQSGKNCCKIVNKWIHWFG